MASQRFQVFLLTLAFVLGQCVAQSKCDVDHVCFAMDQSGSVGPLYPDVQQLVINTATGLNDLTKVVLSAVGFSNSFNVIKSPSSNINSFVNAVKKKVKPAGFTNIYKGLQQCYNYVEKKKGKRIIVLITDGHDKGEPSAKFLVSQKTFTTVSLVTVGIGKNVNAPYLKSLSQIFIPTSSSAIVAVSDLLKRSICKAAFQGNACNEAFKLCDFEFAGKKSLPTFSISGKQDKSFTPSIISKSGPRIGVLNTNGIIPEFINLDGTVHPITMFGSPKLTPTHFKPFSVSRTQTSGIGHQSFTGNQLQTSRKRCVRVFFSTYQTLSNGFKPKVIKNINVEKADNKCVVFRTA